MTGQWRQNAACRGMPVDAFFHPENTYGPTRRRLEEAAKKVCAGCSVRAQCGEWALTTREVYGVYGGLTEEERKQIRGRTTPSRHDPNLSTRIARMHRNGCTDREIGVRLGMTRDAVAKHRHRNHAPRRVS